MQEILNVLNYIAVHFPVEGLVATITGSALLTPITRRLSQKSDLFKMTVVWITFAVGAGVYYLLKTPVNNPSIIALQASAMFAASQPVYMKLFKPLVVWFGEQLAKAAAFDAQIKAAKEVKTETADFSH